MLRKKEVAMIRKYQIFISSTYTDLIDERQVVIDAILNMHQFPVGMEHFSAADSEQWKVIKEAIDTSDYYVLILGKRYGSIITDGEDAGISFTEREFEYAKSKGIPILAFIKSDEASFRGNCFENDATKIKKLATFTENVKTGRIVKWFNHSYQLAEQVITALHNEMEKKDRPGWVRGNQSDIETKVDELIKILKNEFEIDEGGVIEEEDGDCPVSNYVFNQYQCPTDGRHKQVSKNGEPLGEGEWKAGKLINGIEFNWLIRVMQGRLIYKPNCPEDSYDASEDFKCEKMEQYASGISFMRVFRLSEPYIIDDGLDKFFVADLEVTETTEQMKNIRTLEEFLKDKAPERLAFFKEMIELV